MPSSWQSRLFHHTTSKGVVMLVRWFVAAAVVLGFSLVPSPEMEARAAVSRVALPPCQVEDGSGQSACVWDARHRGNGVGRSFVIRHRADGVEVVRYVSHRRAHRIVSRWRVRACRAEWRRLDDDERAGGRDALVACLEWARS